MGDGVVEVAAVAVGAEGAVDDRAADLGVPARVADDGPEFGHAVHEKALVAVRAGCPLVPFVEQLRLVRALAEAVEPQPALVLGAVQATLCWL